MFMLHEGRTKIDLCGIWKYKIDEAGNGEQLGFYKPDFDFDSWKDIKVPNNWYLTEIGDYFGTIWFKTSFKLDNSYEGQKIYLRFGAVDYYADVWLNGEYLGFHEGMFNPFEFDVSDILNADGENTLVVKDGAPRDPTEYLLSEPEGDNPLSVPYKRHQAKEIAMIKGHMIDAMHRPGSMTSFRQDGNSGGIWDAVELVIRPKVFVEYAKIYTKPIIKKDWLGDQKDKPDGSAMVCVDVTVNNTTADVVKTGLSLFIKPYNFESGETFKRTRAVVLAPGKSIFKLVVTVPDAKLWWTWDYGSPNMYTAEITVEDDSIKQNFGIKEVSYDEKKGFWYLNGKQIFLRGMRYISSLWMSEANMELWRPDFDKMLGMNINAIRIGSHVEKDAFYTLCDEAGLLLWQVFPLHYCVSDSDDFISRASDMIRDMGMMLTNHACMGSWSVFKEPEIYNFDDKPNNYHRLCEILKETLKCVDPYRWVHKGDYREGVLNLMFGSGKDGDANPNDFDIQPNIVEFGVHSIPCMETLKTIIPEDKLWPPDWDTWEYWGLFYNRTFKSSKMKLPDTLEEFIETYQGYEATMVKEQIEFIRQRKYRPVSSMYLYYWSDPCPMIGSGLLDYYRRPYKVYNSMKAVYTPVLISIEPYIKPYVLGREKKFRENSTFTARLWVNNDHHHSISNTRVMWRIVKKGTNSVAASHKFDLDLLPDSAEVPDHIVWPIPSGSSGYYRIEMSIVDENKNILSENYCDITVIG